MMLSNYDLAIALAELEADSSDQVGNATFAGRWKQVALAAEQLAGASSTATETINGYMLRAAVALESIAGTTGDEENRTRTGLLKRIVDALEAQAGQVYTGSLGYRFRVAAGAALYGTTYMTIPSYATMAVFGDSIGLGVNASDQVDPGTYWASLLAAHLGATLYNPSLSGTVFSNSNDSGGAPRANNGRDRFVSALTGANLKAAVFIAYGFNDARYIAAPATFNVTAYQADYREVLNGLISLGYARADIYVGSPYYITDTGLNTGSAGFTGQTRAGFEAFVTAAQAVAAEFGVNYSNLYAETNNAAYIAEVTAPSSDNIHPLDLGHSQIYVAWRDKTQAGTTLNTRTAPASVTPTGGVGQIAADCATVSGATSYEFVPMLSWVDGSTATDTDGTGAVMTVAAGTYRVKALAVFGDGTKSPWVFAAANVTVTAVDDVPDAFTFTDVTGATVSTLYTSNTITVAGLGSGISTAVSITGGQYSKNGGAYTSAAGTAVNGDTFAVQQTSSASGGTATNTVLTIGGVSDTYTTTTAGGASSFLADDFAGTSGTAITSSTAETGGAWSVQSGYVPSPASALDGSGGVYSPSPEGCYQNAATPPSADYYVECIVKQVSVLASTNAGPAGRMAAAANTMYFARWLQASTAWQLFKIVNGTANQLGANYVDAGFTAGVSRTVRLTMTGTTIKMHVDGVEQVSETDGAITAAGKAGVRMGSGATDATDTTGPHIMDIVAV